MYSTYTYACTCTHIQERIRVINRTLPFAAMASSSSVSRAGVLSLEQGTKINPDLQKERDTGTFNPLDLTYEIDGGKDITERRQYIESLAFNDPDFQCKDVAFMTREESYTNSIRIATLCVKKLKELDINDITEAMWYRSAASFGNLPSMTLHESMFMHSVLSQATEEQQVEWLTKAQDHTILGTYAQTELGHGTFVRGLETTATYDPSTEEFVMHSPTLTSIKWWPGNLGKSVTHAVVAAQLYTKGKCYGIHMFMVPLRSLEDHTPLPGIELGDIGPKLGYANIDNGFLRFTHFRIPRENMFMKYSRVEPDGTYVAPPVEKLSYGSMVLIRSLIVGGMGHCLAKGSTIATRYSAVRHQSELVAGGGEPQVLDYQSQQLKLFPYIASAYAFLFAGKHMQEMFADSVNQVSAGNFNVLPELHATAAGLKAFTSNVAIPGIEQLRMACGGHGYSAASGFPLLYGNETPACTYEGENTVMLLQTARFLMKCVRQLKAGTTFKGIMAYLADHPQQRCMAQSEDDFLNAKTLLDAYRHRAQRIVFQAATNLDKAEKSGLEQAVAWNQQHLYLIRAANAHCHLAVVEIFLSALQRSEAPEAIKKVLMTMFQMYAIHGLSEYRGEFLQDGYLTGQQLDAIDRILIRLLKEIRPNAVTLVDAFDIDDNNLASVMGRYDGNVYENMYKWAKSAPMNDKEVKDAYHLYIGPFLKENRAKSKL
ncbi:peroxisomal acyl-coenzyme A oxidase 1-like isoform X1 [Acanthaster planci]|uniref:Acyl-coenzyme A oxidase n=1 Tax=Acanthaster planci TaxID=133434 RepID=A0A8B7Y8M6_ACAPL|nr:peroxisomal acyl-coenzyme A oxidase 1-like isoform X1 [Acanthaster planci]